MSSHIKFFYALLISLVGAMVVAGFLFGNQALNKIADLRYRFQLLERRVDSLGEVMSAPLKRHQAKRGAPEFQLDAAPARAGKWRLLGGEGANGSWSGDLFQKAKAMAAHQADLYVGLLGQERGSAAIWRFDGTRWQSVADAEKISGWKARSYVQDLLSVGDVLYAGVDDEVWRFAEKTWSRLAGANGSFPWPSGYNAYTLESHGGDLYLGLTGDAARVFRFAAGAWEEVSDGLPQDLTDGVYELFEHTDNRLYAAVTTVGGPGRVYRLDGSGWTLIGGAGIKGSWISDGSTYPLCLTSFQGSLIVTLNRNPQLAGQFVSIWAFQNDNWFPIGQSSFPAIWSQTDNFNACGVFRNRLYVAGGGRPAGNAGVYELSAGMKWRRIGGNGIQDSWSPNRQRMSGWRATAEYVYRLVEWRGQLIAGFGDAPNAAQVWAYTPAGEAGK